MCARTSTAKSTAGAARVPIGCWRGGDASAGKQIPNFRRFARNGDGDGGGGRQVVLHNKRVVIVTEERDLRGSIVNADGLGRAH